MLKSEDRILTTHTGSLPRTAELVSLLNKKDAGVKIDPEQFEKVVKDSLRIVVLKQQEAGIDIANDGEQSRVGFDTYVYNRMTGFGGEGIRSPIQDLEEFPEYAEKAFPAVGVRVTKTPKAIAPIKYTDLSSARKEIEDYKEILLETSAKFKESFMTAASPGAIAGILLNEYYESHRDYVFALAEQMQKEYEFIVNSDLLLQLDCPDLAMERHWMFKELSTPEFKEIVILHIEAINQAIENIPSEKVRLHVCWGNYEGPHHRDIALEDILPDIYRAKVGALSVEQANPRHQHEYRVFHDYPLPKEKLLIPGVIDVKTNFIEHPEVVANRIKRVAEAVGDPSKIIAGTDCGFETFAGWRLVDTNIAWAKLKSLSEGAKLASAALF
ncbi:MAG: cobalamin-independent methionine synthase II family protein [Methanophagales archaeon]|nr:cobalamin-independent methionine synthase II family protein [Methanophagales archaeon]